MRALFTLFVGSTLAVAAVAHDTPADRGPGIVAERQGDAHVYRASGFDRVALGGAAALDVRVGADFSVRATGPDAALARLRVVQEDGTLKIEQRYRNNGVSEDRTLEEQVRFVVTMPRVSGVMLGGSGSVNVDRVAGGTFSATLGGSGDIRLDDVAVETATVTIGGSGSVAAAGRADTLQVMLGGSGRLDAPGLRAAQATVTSAGSGRVTAAVDGKATVRVVGSGTVDLGAKADCTIMRQGRGIVRCRT